MKVIHRFKRLTTGGVGRMEDLCFRVEPKEVYKGNGPLKMVK